MLLATGPARPIQQAAPSPTATYPSLWNHDARRRLEWSAPLTPIASSGTGMEDKAADVWATASRAHLNLDFTIQFSALGSRVHGPREHRWPRAWPNVIFLTIGSSTTLSCMGNCTLGLLCFWWHSNRQVAGRGLRPIPPRVPPRAGSPRPQDEQLRTAEDIFNEFRDVEMKPAYLADADPNRALLDRRVVCDLLGFDEEVYAGVRRLAAKWCAEPSVHGGKARPKDAKLVV